MPCRSRLAGDQGQRGMAGLTGRGQARSYRNKVTQGPTFMILFLDKL